MHDSFEQGGSSTAAVARGSRGDDGEGSVGDEGTRGSERASVTRILEVVSGILSDTNSTGLAERVIEEAALMTGAQGGAIFLSNGDGVLTPDVMWSREQGAAFGGRTAIGQEVALWVARRNTPLLLNHLREQARIIDYGDRPAISSLISVPLDLGPKKGVLNAYSNQEGAFTEADLENLRLFGDLACLILRRDTDQKTLTTLNTSLKATDDRLIKEISRVHLGLRMSRNVLAASGFEQQAISVCREIREQFHLTGVAVFLVNHIGTRIQGIAADGFTDFNIGAQDYLIADVNGTAAPCTISRAASRGESQFFAVEAGETAHREEDAADSWESGPYACIPLRAHQQTIGVIVVCEREKERVFLETIATLETFADLVSLAILQARSSGDAQQAYLEILSTLANVVEMRDSYTGMHTENVMAYSVALARAAGLTGAIIEDIRLGSILHDIGKIAVMDSVLHKTGALLPDEYETMKRHTEVGAEIITSAHLLRGAYNIVRHHHERWDGTGYPDRLGGHDIPLTAQIVAIADAYDAMTTDRPYRGMITPSDAVTELRRCAGTQFSPALVEIFISAVIDERNDACEVECRDEGCVLWLSVTGALTPLTSRALLSRVLEWIRPVRRHVIVDLSGAGRMMEAVLWSLQQINSKCRALDGFLVIIATGDIREQIVGSAQGVQFRVFRTAERVRELLASYADITGGIHPISLKDSDFV